MKFNLRKYWIEVYTYYSDKPIEEFRNDLSVYLEQTQKLKSFFKTNITGELLSDNRFELRPKWELGSSYMNRGNPSTYLYGEMFPLRQKTKIVFSVTPYPFTLIFAVLSFLFGLAMFINLFTQKVDWVYLLFTALLLIVLPVLIISIGQYFKRKLKKDFVIYFKLTDNK